MLVEAEDLKISLELQSLLENELLEELPTQKGFSRECIKKIAKELNIKNEHHLYRAFNRQLVKLYKYVNRGNSVFIGNGLVLYNTANSVGTSEKKTIGKNRIKNKIANKANAISVLEFKKLIKTKYINNIYFYNNINYRLHKYKYFIKGMYVFDVINLHTLLPVAESKIAVYKLDKFCMNLFLIDDLLF